LDSAAYWYCGHPNDDANHTVFRCDTWATKRLRVEMQISGNFNPEIMVIQMLESKEKWDAISNFLHDVMEKKEADERTRQNNPY